MNYILVDKRSNKRIHWQMYSKESAHKAARAANAYIARVGCAEAFVVVAATEVEVRRWEGGSA